MKEKQVKCFGCTCLPDYDPPLYRAINKRLGNDIKTVIITGMIITKVFRIAGS
jgi:hypothetical protein